MSLLWPSRRFVGRGRPQGAVAAPMGATYLDETNGVLWRKTVGSGPTGWYFEPAPGAMNWAGWVPTEANAVALLSAVGATVAPTFAPGTTIFRSIGQPVDRSFVGGYTTPVANNAMLMRPGALAGAGPLMTEGLDYAQEQDAEIAFDVLTTPRPTAASSATDLTNIRIWAGMARQNTATLTTDATLASSDTLQTAFANSLAAGASLNAWAGMFRFSTAAGDPGWVFVTSQEVGAVFQQTVTNLGVPIAANTIYRLRLRYLRSRTPKAFAVSVNDGAETIITANVGPGNGLAVSPPTGFLIPYGGVQTLAAALKSLTVGRMLWSWGNYATT